MMPSGRSRRRTCQDEARAQRTICDQDGRKQRWQVGFFNPRFLTFYKHGIIVHIPYLNFLFFVMIHCQHPSILVSISFSAAEYFHVLMCLCHSTHLGR